jgi:acyl-coenzyme A thioesterase PaaI-like protein
MPDNEAEEVDVVAQMNAGLEVLIPVAHRMGVRFTELRPGFAQTSVPFEGNGNHFGVIYAGVIFTVAEVLGGGLHFVTFDVSTHYPLVKSVQIDFLLPGKTPLTAQASLSDDEVARLKAESAGGQKANFELIAEVLGEDGTIVARTRGDYQLRPYGA